MNQQFINKTSLCTDNFAWKKWLNPKRFFSGDMFQVGGNTVPCKNYARHLRDTFRKIAQDRMCKKSCAQFFYEARHFDDIKLAVFASFDVGFGELTRTEQVICEFVYKISYAEGLCIRHWKYWQQFNKGDTSRINEYNEFISKHLQRKK